MNKRKDIIFYLLFVLVTLSFAMLLSACTTDSTEEGTEDGNGGTIDDKGMRFDGLAEYKTDILQMPVPMTYEATVCFPEDYTDRGGVIFGNYVDSKTTCVNFEIYEEGAPRVYIIDNNGNRYNILFSEINVCSGKPTHIAISGDFNTGEWKCYIDGELEQTIIDMVPRAFSLESDFAFGGDGRSNNSQYFKGELYTLRLYSDTRDCEEIALDAKGKNDDDGLIAAYRVSARDEWSDEGIDAVGDQKFNLSLHSDWIKDIPESENYAYSFAVIGDIQTLSYSYPETLLDMFEWIRDNKDEKKIAFSVGLGDLTEKNTEGEYLKAIEAYDKIDGTVPFSIIRGNHDRKGFSSAMYDTYITQQRYGDEITGSYDGSMLNTYRIIKVGEIDYLFLNLDYLLTDEVIAWANEVVSEHRECQVIVSTHIYMTKTGAYYNLDGSSGIGTKYGVENNGEGLWDKLLSRHENIVMLICGHNPTDDIYYRQREGINGNKVTEILIDPQSTDKNYSGTGLVAMFYFSADGKHLDVQYYSTAKDAFFKTNNQFSLDLDTPNK